MINVHSRLINLHINIIQNSIILVILFVHLQNLQEARRRNSHYVGIFKIFLDFKVH